MSSGAISVRIGIFPEMNTTEPYSPIPLAKASANPVSSGGISSGRITLRKIRQRPAPSVAAASSVSLSMSSSTG
ncbi:hypothetical protein D3C73_1622260 [compost metagenome]